MKTLVLLPLIGLAASAALADPVTRATTYDGPNASGTRVAVRDKDAGTYSRDTNVVRKSDGATASRDYDRTRTDSGYTASGTATGRNGQTYALSADRARTDNGYTADRTVTNASGATLYDRSVVATRANGNVDRTVTTSRAAGFQRPHFGGGRRH